MIHHLWSELFPKKRREKIQGEILQSIFEYSGVSTYNPEFLQELQRSPNTSVFQSPGAILQLQVSTVNSSYRINSPKKYYNYKALQCSSPCLQHSPVQNPSILPAPYSTPSATIQQSRLPVTLSGRNSILHGSQHPRSPYSNSQVQFQFYITEFYQEK